MTKLSTDRLLRFLFPIGLALLVLALTPFRVDPVFSIKEDVFTLISTLIIVLGLWHICRNGFSINKPILIFGLFVCFAMISTSWAPNRYEAFKEAYRWALIFGVMLIAYQIDATRRKSILYVGMITGAIASSLGILEYYGIPVLFSEHGKLISLFGHQNLLGQYLSIVFVWSVCMFLFQKKYRWLSFICALINLYGLFITVCRSAWLASVVGLGFVLILSAMRQSVGAMLKKILLVCLVACICLGSFYFVERILSYRSTSLSDDVATRSKLTTYSPSKVLKQPQDVLKTESPLSGREIIWKSTWTLIKRSPVFGYGIGNYWIVFPSTDPEFVDFSKYVHNDYLQVCLETGVLGFILFVSFLAMAFIKILHHRPDDSSNIIYYSLFAAVVVICVDAVFSYDFCMPVPSYIFAVSMGTLLTMSYLGKKRVQLGKSLKIFLILVCFSLMLLAGWWLYIRNAGFYYYYKASADIKEQKDTKDFTQAKIYLGTACRYLPYEPELLFFDVMLELHDGNFAVARQKGYNLLDLTPYEKKILLLMAKIEAIMGNEGSSEQLYSRLVASDSPLDSVYVQNMLEHYDMFSEQMHTSALTVGSAEKMLNELDSTLSKQPENTFAHFIRGTLLLKKAAWVDAGDDFSYCIKYGNKYPLAYLFRGMCHARTRNLEQAYRDYEQYAQFDPKSEVALLGLAIAAQKMGLSDEAEQRLQEVLHLNPNNAKALRNMGILQMERGNESAAADYFSRSLQIDPHQANAAAIRAVIDSVRASAQEE